MTDTFGLRSPSVDFFWMAALLLLGAAIGPSRGASSSEAKAGFSHAAWERVLARFVDEKGLVDYRALAAGRTDLDLYIGLLERQGPRSTPGSFPAEADRLAYYLNAYNALVFKGVLARGPETQSVWKGGLISGYSFFVGMKVRLDGQETSLKSLEDKIIRAGFGDPRIHAALNCASLGCPRLPREAFDPSRLDLQLTAAMTEFVEEARNVTLDEPGKTVTLSKIFDWFEDDFLKFEKARGNPDPVLADYINRFRASKPKIDRTFRVRFFEYDKRINAR